MTPEIAKKLTPEEINSIANWRDEASKKAVWYFIHTLLGEINLRLEKPNLFMHYGEIGKEKKESTSFETEFFVDALRGIRAWAEVAQTKQK